MQGHGQGKAGRARLLNVEIEKIKVPDKTNPAGGQGQSSKAAALQKLVM